VVLDPAVLQLRAEREQDRADQRERDPDGLQRGERADLQVRLLVR